MPFNLETFQKLMTVAQVSAQEAGAVAAQWGSGDHVGAVTTAVTTAGAMAKAATSDPTKQAEADAATQLATTLLPSIFAFASLFAKKS